MFNELKTNPNRNKIIWDILDELIIGEEYNKKVIYYTLASAKLTERGKTAPLGLYITGSSSSGKTHMVRECMKLFPESMLIKLGGASEKALRYMDGFLEPMEEFGKDEKGNWIKYKKIIDFTGKILWFLEDTGGEKTFSDIRPILSRDQKEIRFTTTVKGKDSQGGEKFQNQEVYIRGCPSFVTTSTKSEILSETGTRVIQISPDETKDQSQRIVKNKLLYESSYFKEPNFKPYQLFMEGLESKDVWVPFTDLLELPLNNLNIRRDIDKIITLIKVNALINQKDRREIVLKGNRVLVATMEDFFEAMGVILPVIKPTLLNIPKKVVNFYEWVIFKKNLNPEFELVTTNISRETRLSQSTVRTYCKTLEDSGKLLLVGKEGHANKYELMPSDDSTATAVTKNPVAVENQIIDSQGLKTSSMLTATAVTKNPVAAYLWVRSLEKTELLLNLYVSKLYSKATITDLLLYMYFPVAVKRYANFDTTEVVERFKASQPSPVTVGDGSGGYELFGCLECGLKLEKYKLDIEGKCPLCSTTKKVDRRKTK